MPWTAPKIYTEKNNWKAKLIRCDSFPVANAVKEWHAYLLDSPLLLILPLTVSLVISSSLTRTFLFTSITQKRQVHMTVPRPVMAMSRKYFFYTKKATKSRGIIFFIQYFVDIVINSSRLVFENEYFYFIKGVILKFNFLHNPKHLKQQIAFAQILLTVLLTCSVNDIHRSMHRRNHVLSTDC